MNKKLLILCVLTVVFGLASLAYAEVAMVKSEQVNMRIAKETYDSGTAFKATYQATYQGADGEMHKAVIQAVAIKREKLQSEYSWTKTANRAAGVELKIKVRQSGKAVLMADDPFGQLIETEVLMPSGDILEIMVDARNHRKEFGFSVRTVKTMEEVK